MVDQFGAAPPTLPVSPGQRDETLVSAYAELTNLLLQAPDVIAFLQQVAELAAMAIAPPASCGITLRRGSEVSTVASIGEMASVVDELQYAQGNGPCMQALRNNEVVYVSDMRDETRWEGFRINAVAQGVRSSLSTPLAVGGHGVGALNLYSDQPHRFSDEEVVQTGAFARQASTLLSVVMSQARATEISDQLQDALISRAVIDQALGILMVREQCSATEAFATLRQTSQHRNLKLATVAAELIRSSTGHEPQAPRAFSRR